MSINRSMAHLLISSGAKVVPKFCAGQIDPYIEWVKWLSYESSYEKQIMDLVSIKTVLEISNEELDEISRIKRNKMFAELFKKYGTDECSKEESIMVYNYMCTESIESLMMSKLSSNELSEAKEKIIYFSKLSSEELHKKVHEEQKEDIYEKLSMVDAYVLHIISNISFARSMERLNNEINAQIKSNNAMYQRTLYYASNPYSKR